MLRTLIEIASLIFQKIQSKLNLVTAELFENARLSDLKSARSPVDQYLAQSTDQTSVSTVGV